MSQTLLSQSRFYLVEFSLDTFSGFVCFADPLSQTADVLE